MEPIALILSALTAGAAAVATASAQAGASEAIKDAYQGLKTLIHRSLASEAQAKSVLTRFQEQPEVWEVQLTEALTKAHADENEEIVQAAQELMALADPKQAAMGKYNVQIAGNVTGLVQGDNAQVEMTFEDKSKEN